MLQQTKVSQFNGRNGAVKNQFEITTPQGKIFQSYDSVIAFIPNEGKIQLDSKYWNYSVTTSKYRNQFLNEDKKSTQKKIDSGEYELTNLN